MGRHVALEAVAEGVRTTSTERSARFGSILKALWPKRGAPTERARPRKGMRRSTCINPPSRPPIGRVGPRVRRRLPRRSVEARSPYRTSGSNPNTSRTRRCPLRTRTRRRLTCPGRAHMHEHKGASSRLRRCRQTTPRGLGASCSDCRGFIRLATSRRSSTNCRTP